MSHHYSGPDYGFPNGDARLDLTDLYAFPKPGDPGKSILVMDVHPSASVNPPGQTTPEPFSDRAIYEFKIDTNGDLVADLAYRVTFSHFENGAQTATVRRVSGEAAALTDDGGETIIDKAPVSTGHDAKVTETRGYRFFAGWRSDPFFFDTRGAINNFQFTGEDFFAVGDVCSIVVEAPNSVLGSKELGLLGSHIVQDASDGRELGPSRSRRATLANPIPRWRAERSLSRRGTGQRCPIHPCLRTRA